MINGLRLSGFLCIAILLVGCGESRTSGDTRGYYGAFNGIAREVKNMNVQINSEFYKGQDSPVEDQLGAAINSAMTNEDVKGTPLEAEVQKLKDQEAKILEIWKSPDGSLEKLRAAGKEMQEMVDHLETLV
jgi:hypothetical protein